MKMTTRKLLTVFLSLLMLLQMFGAAAPAAFAASERSDESELTLEFRMPDEENEGETVVVNLAESFSEDPVLNVSAYGRADERRLNTTPSYGALRENGLYLMPPEGYYIDSILLVNSTEETEIIGKAEASADDASLFLAKERFSNDGEASILPEGDSALKLVINLVPVDEEAEIQVRYTAGALDLEGALVEDGNTFQADEGHTVLSLLEAQANAAAEKGASFIGWLLCYGEDGASVSVAPNDPIQPYRSCLLIAQWEIEDNRETPTEPSAEPSTVPSTEPTEITLSLASGVKTEKVYDGTPLTLSADDVTVTGLPEGATCELELSMDKEAVNGGDQATLTVSIKSIKKGGSTLDPSTYTYAPLKKPITITKRPVTVSASAEKVYDGTPLTLDNASNPVFSCGSGELLSGHTLQSVGSNATQTDAGVFSGTVDASRVKIVDGNGTDMTKNYNVLSGTALLTVNRRPLMIKTSSAIKVYDGTPLTDHTSPTATGLLSGHRLPITFTGSQTKAGISPNSIKTDFSITSNDVDVTKNYEISYEFGFLAVFNASDLTYVKGSKKDVTIRLELDNTDFNELMVNGTRLTDSQVSAEKENKFITVKASYLETLNVGNYPVTIRYRGLNDLKITLTVKGSNGGNGGNGGNSNSPLTGDSAQPVLYACLFGGSALALGGLAFYLVKKNKKEKQDK